MTHIVVCSESLFIISYYVDKETVVFVVPLSLVLLSFLVNPKNQQDGHKLNRTETVRKDTQKHCNALSKDTKIND